jgi:hypothetical protein
VVVELATDETFFGFIIIHWAACVGNFVGSCKRPAFDETGLGHCWLGRDRSWLLAMLVLILATSVIVLPVAVSAMLVLILATSVIVLPVAASRLLRAFHAGVGLGLLSTRLGCGSLRLLTGGGGGFFLVPFSRLNT